MIPLCLSQSSCGVLDKDVVSHKDSRSWTSLNEASVCVTFIGLVKKVIMSTTNKHVLH